MRSSPSSLLSVPAHQELMTCGLALCAARRCVCVFVCVQSRPLWLMQTGGGGWKGGRVLLFPPPLSGYRVHKSNYDSRKWPRSEKSWFSCSDLPFFLTPLSSCVSVFLKRMCVCVCEGEIKQSNGERGKEGGGRERECVQRGRGQSMCVCVCVCVCSQGFDTAIQALRLPWSRPPYMAIGVKEQREWAVWGSMHTHTHTQEGCGGSLSSEMQRA